MAATSQRQLYGQLGH